MNNPLDLFAWKVRSERKRQHLTQKQLAERLGMNPRTIIDLETCQSNPKFETVVLVAKELNISVDAAIFPEMVNQTVSKTVVDFFAGKSEAEIEKFIALCGRVRCARPRYCFTRLLCGQFIILLFCKHFSDARRTPG